MEAIDMSIESTNENNAKNVNNVVDQDDASSETIEQSSYTSEAEKEESVHHNHAPDSFGSASSSNSSTSRVSKDELLSEMKVSDTDTTGLNQQCQEEQEGEEAGGKGLSDSLAMDVCRSADGATVEGGSNSHIELPVESLYDKQLVASSTLIFATDVSKAVILESITAKNESTECEMSIKPSDDNPDIERSMSTVEMREVLSLCGAEVVSSILSEASRNVTRASETSNLSAIPGVFQVNDKVEANYRGLGWWYAGSIIADRGDESYDIFYEDGESEVKVPIHQIRLAGLSQMKTDISAPETQSDRKAKSKDSANIMALVEPYDVL
jgi:hypothetical protein